MASVWEDSRGPTQVQRAWTAHAALPRRCSASVRFRNQRHPEKPTAARTSYSCVEASALPLGAIGRGEQLVQ